MNKFFTITIILFSTTTFASVDKVDPPHWWVGMEHQTLQLMFYGEKVGTHQITLQRYKGVKIDKIHRLTHPNYLIVDLKFSKSLKAGQLQFTFSRRDKSGYSFEYVLHKRAALGNLIRGFKPSDSIYLITPDRFANGDSSNDNIEGFADPVDRSEPFSRHGGDIQGIIDNIGYIKDMGFTMIWLNPILINEPEIGSYHGYAASDMYRVDPRLGSHQLYRSMVEKASEEGLGVIMDVIVNHVGTEHPWVRDLSQDDFFNVWPEYTQTNHAHSSSMDPHVALSEKKQFNDGWFVPNMADLNQRNPQVSRYLIQNSIYWIEELQLAGIRMDTYSYSDNQFMSDWAKAIMQQYPYFNIVGEEWIDKPSMVAYFQKGKQNSDGYISYLPTLMDFPLALNLGPALGYRPDSRWQPDGFIKIYQLLAEDFVYPNPKNLVIFADNHDMDRIFTQLEQDVALLKNALLFILTMRGTPQIYYGTEILMHNSDSPSSQGVIRSDFPGGWPADLVNAFRGEGLSHQQKEVQEYLRSLLHWRKTAKAVHEGELIHYLPYDAIYVYFRKYRGSMVMVVLNKNEQQYQLSFDRFAEIIGSNTSGIDIISSRSFKLDKPITLEPNTPMLIEIFP